MPTAPGFTSRELLTRLFDIRDDTLGFLLECGRRFGNLTRFEAGNQRAFFINHPDLVKHVLQDNHRNYTKDTIQYNSLATITGRGLLTSDGSLWLRQRRLEQPAFARPRMMALDGVVLPAVEMMLARWAKQAEDTGREAEVDVDGEMMRLTLEVVGKALFSIDLSRDARRLTEAVLTALDHIVYKARHPIGLPASIPTPRNRRFAAALKTLDEAVYGMLSERRASGEPGSDLLGMLLQARDEETGQVMSDAQIRDEVITLLIAGHETVASALTWTWYLLALNPSAGSQLKAEVDTVLGSRPPQSSDLANLPYCAQIFSEALRLYPPAWLITRAAQEADELEGNLIPPGTLMIISPYTLHRQPDFWPNPDSFEPERFLRGENTRRFSYIPFGAGPRLCIGSSFAQIEAQLILARVTQQFRLEMDPGSKVTVDALVTLRPRGGLQMRLVPNG